MSHEGTRVRHNLVVPDLGLGSRHVTLSLWLVELGAEVTEGDRLVELSADSVTVDLPAPASGRFVESLAVEDEEIAVGQVLGVVESDD
jgi:pyruvate/2-oxoglutarate dehydrogenase complex dihydrolipoamide acyltransferase (E2) component